MADVGCGLGSSCLLIAEAFPQATIVGSDYHADSIELARKKAADAGVTDRVSFEVADAANFTGAGYDLVMTLDSLHDMGDPVTAARRVREALAPDGAWLVVEPFVPNELEEQLQPGGPPVLQRLDIPVHPQRTVPARRPHPWCPGGEAAVRQVATEAGFTRFRRIAESPFNIAYEIRL